MMLEIKNPSVAIEDQSAILTADIYIKDEKKTLWYSVPIEYKDFLCYERSDSFVVALLLFAMEKGENIKCDQVISEKLYFSLTKYLIPFLCKVNPKLKKIDILCDIDNSILISEKKVGTGISCGVDSLSTILYHGMETNTGNYTINQLTLFNSGYYGSKDDNANKFKKYIEQSIDFSQEFQYPLLCVNSNISNVTQYKFLEVHTYLSCSVVLAIQKLFSVYYYASGYPIYNFKACFDDPAYYDLFLLECLSTENVNFISANTTMSRVEKIESLVKHEKYLHHLYVCTAGNPPHNCGRCEKCIRTLLAIDSMNALDKVAINFDIKAYKSRRSFNIASMLVKKNKNIYYKEIYINFKKRQTSIPIMAYFFIPFAYLANSKLKLILAKKLNQQQKKKLRGIKNILRKKSERR